MGPLFDYDLACAEVTMVLTSFQLFTMSAHLTKTIAYPISEQNFLI